MHSGRLPKMTGMLICRPNKRLANKKNTQLSKISSLIQQIIFVGRKMGLGKKKTTNK